MKKYAFTLAEVLITLGIIGFIAAMTLPALIQKQIEKHTVTRVKKLILQLLTHTELLNMNTGIIFEKR